MRTAWHRSYHERYWRELQLLIHRERFSRRGPQNSRLFIEKEPSDSPDGRLLTGTRPEPTFLITKPFQRSTVKAAISQALFFDAATVPAA
jgi:hypothetical protein